MSLVSSSERDFLLFDSAYWPCDESIKSGWVSTQALLLYIISFLFEGNIECFISIFSFWQRPACQDQTGI
jgi:hypothetical protein